MAPLVSIPELAVAAQSDIPADDPFATWVLDSASLLVRETARHPEWEAGTVPARAKLICTLLAQRTYLNSTGVTYSQVGPVAERYDATHSSGLELTDAEKEVLWSMIGDEETGWSGSQLWLQPIGRDAETGILYYPTANGGLLPWLDPELNEFYTPLLDGS